MWRSRYNLDSSSSIVTIILFILPVSEISWKAKHCIEHALGGVEFDLTAFLSVFPGFITYLLYIFPVS